LKHRHMTIRVVPATHAKNNFGEVIKRVYERDEVQIIERDGLPVAGIVSMSDIERLYPEKIPDLPKVGTSAKRQRAARRLRAILTEMQKGGEQFSEEEVEADAQRAVEEVRHGRHA
jgi:prevent-host-death family protein